MPLLTRRTRFVLLSDTHSHTPSLASLPAGDVLIHAGDLTKQGSYEELKRAVAWLESLVRREDGQRDGEGDGEAKVVKSRGKGEAKGFEKVIVVAGNHDITLDAAFYHEQHSSYRWPSPQDPELSRQLFTSSPYLTYLEHSSTTIRLTSPQGPQTHFTLFGSPYSPVDPQNAQKWAFQYEAHDASRLWAQIPNDADIVVTHTPPLGCCDTATKDERSGCGSLLRELYRVRPMISLFGHIHGARGAQRVVWKDGGGSSDRVEGLGDEAAGEALVESVEVWADPGLGSNRQSLVDVSHKGERPLRNGSRVRHEGTMDEAAGEHGASEAGALPYGQAGSTPRFHVQVASMDGAAHEKSPIALESCEPHYPLPQALFATSDGHATKAQLERQETLMVNAAYLGPRLPGKGTTMNKPIVVDVDLPVWGGSRVGGEN